MMTLEQLRTQLWPQMAASLEPYLLALGEDDTLLTRMTRYQLDVTGKRVRPVLSYVSAMDAGASCEAALAMGAIVEVIHNASLVHDDIQDGDQFRRGREAVWKAFSPRQAINLGDMLMTLALSVALDMPLEPLPRIHVMQLTVRAIGDLVRGQVRDIDTEGTMVSMEEYRAIASGKTGALFRLALVGGGLLGQGGDEQPPALGHLENLGTDLGVLFQMRDDCIEVLGQKDGRQFSSELRSQKASLINAVAGGILTAADQHTYSLLLSTLNESPNSRRDLVEFLRSRGVLSEALNILRAWRLRVEASPALAPGGQLKPVLLTITASLCDDLQKDFP
ncbi:polyprenyl synthetase family protein [Myxococcota bacterium]|nr:polyprenyl synthetase family protein [Myxococcota bacterium]